jgi:dimethylhistidine N-methyltransferase
MPDDVGLARHPANQSTLDAALPGLRAARKTLPAKLFYDEIGCRLFQEITRLPEYYLTRTEVRLLKTVAPATSALMPPGSTLVEYGASDESKAVFFLRQRDDHGGPVFLAYVPIDVAEAPLQQACARLAREMPELELYPITADFMHPLILPALRGRPRLGFFPGSTIGNLEPAEACSFLKHVRLALGPGARFLISTDLDKDPDVLIAAYDDAAGVTAAFNLNLLTRLNREAGADFDVDAFRHGAVWNAQESRIEMHLFSQRDQVVTVGDERIAFLAGESIHTENSYKWPLAVFDSLACEAGWHRLRLWVEPNAMYAVHLLEAG